MVELKGAVSAVAIAAVVTLIGKTTGHFDAIIVVAVYSVRA
jgi:hypothetical protein